MAAGHVAEKLGLAPNTLTFHFDRLRVAGLVTVRRDGRSMIYAARFETMNDLVSFLTENCCQGALHIVRARGSLQTQGSSAMKRFHVHVAVDDLQQSIGFYSALFAAEPSVIKTDYAKWMLDDPRVNFAISTRGRQAGLDHLGIQVENKDELKEIYGRLHKAGGNVIEQGQTSLLLRQVGKVLDRRSGRHFVGNLSHDGRKHRLRRRHWRARCARCA